METRDINSGEQAVAVTREVRTACDAALATFLAEHRAHASAISSELAPLFDVLADFIAGGKRMRPLFGYWGVRAAGIRPELSADDPYVRALTCLEWLHACALIHDDIMDASLTRRGMPATHHRFASMHRDSGWRGEADHFGVSAAILLGDLCLSWCDEALHIAGLPLTSVAGARGLLDTMRSELMYGQYLDVASDAIEAASRGRARTVLRYKSGKYTVEYPMLIGAALAGVTDGPVPAALSTFGLGVGEAFQLRDDVLGVFGDSSVTGKPAGDDLREGKRTLLIQEAMERLPSAEAGRLRAALGQRDLDESDISQLRELVAGCGALAATERQIAETTDQAIGALVGLPVDVAVALRQLAYKATQRVA